MESELSAVSYQLSVTPDYSWRCANFSESSAGAAGIEVQFEGADEKIHGYGIVDSNIYLLALALADAADGYLLGIERNIMPRGSPNDSKTQFFVRTGSRHAGAPDGL